ncbi:MAG: TonB-dependent receptor [Syntrophales bacterium]|jgi:vitamin B12 transporter|nr:TonB-dependent receptor [Syntrophales bacterium]
MNRLQNFVLFPTIMVLAFSIPVYGMEAKLMKEVVVTATRIETPAEEVGSSLTVITADDIAAKGYRTVDEVLRGTAGLDVAVAGGPGQQSSAFLRGAESYQTLVRIDGIEVNDPSGINRGFNFANLTVDNIERIEILRGPQSPLYGADAMGGVISIITRKGTGAPRFFAEGEGGSHGTWRESAGASMRGERLNVSFEASHISAKGFSAADAGLPGNIEKDKWENTSAGARVGVVVSERVDFDFTGRLQEGRTHLDQGGGPFQDAFDYSVDERKLLGRAQARILAFDGLWEQTLAYGLVDHARDYKDDPWAGDYRFDGRKEELSWLHNLYLQKNNTATLGFEYEREELTDLGALNAAADTRSVFLQDQLKLGGISFTTVGLRYDDHENFGGKTTYRLTQAFLIKEWDVKLKGSLGTGFRAPSLNELFYINPWGGPGGNPDLAPEESRGWDLGIERTFLGEALTVGITYFQNDFENLIVWKNGYENAETAQSDGIESFIDIIAREDLSFRFTYTYTNTRDSNRKQLLRRPLHKAYFNARYRFFERGTANLDILYTGERDDSYWNAMTFTTDDVVLEEYLVVNLSGLYEISDNLRLFARVENLFDEDYYEAYGYAVPGLSVYGGLRVSF